MCDSLQHVATHTIRTCRYICNVSLLTQYIHVYTSATCRYWHNTYMYIHYIHVYTSATCRYWHNAYMYIHVQIKKQKRSLSLPIVRRCTRDILKGVEYLHNIRVAHRDLKPANILVFKDMTCKLGFFFLWNTCTISVSHTATLNLPIFWFLRTWLSM